MRIHQSMSARASKIGLALVLVFAVAVIVLVDKDSGSQVMAQSLTQIEVTIFSYDGQDFVRTKSTLVTDEGKSAVNTKLDRDTPAYQALIKKRSYTGDATLFGRKYDVTYAPLISENDQLIGALFVGITQ